MERKEFFPITTEEYDRLVRESAAAEANEPRATVARYDAPTHSMLLSMRGGATLIVPISALNGLEAAGDAELSRVAVMDNGYYVDWPLLDVQWTVQAIIYRVLGTESRAASARRAGSVTSAKKAVSSARNGAKGGRPRKKQVA